MEWECFLCYLWNSDFVLDVSDLVNCHRVGEYVITLYWHDTMN